MRSGPSAVLVGGLLALLPVGCADASRPAVPAAASAPKPMTPDMQEGGPVTRVVTTHFFQDGSDSWSADIIREALGLPGSVNVIGPGPASQALVFAARACMEDGGTFQPDGPGFERAMPQGTNIGFRFPGACL